MDPEYLCLSLLCDHVMVMAVVMIVVTECADPVMQTSVQNCSVTFWMLCARVG